MSVDLDADFTPDELRDEIQQRLWSGELSVGIYLALIIAHAIYKILKSN